MLTLLFLDADIDIRDHSGRKPSHHLQSTVTHDVKSKYYCVSVALFCMYYFMCCYVLHCFVCIILENFYLNQLNGFLFLLTLENFI